MKNLSWTLGRGEQRGSSMRRHLCLQLWPGSPWQQCFCRTMEDEWCPPYFINFSSSISFWQRKVLSSTHEYFSVSEPDSCEKSLSFLLPPNSFLRMVMVLQRSYLICLLLRGNNGIQLSVSEGFRSFGFLFFSYFSLVKLGDKETLLLQLQRVKHHSHMSQLLLWETFRFSDLSFLHKKNPNK